MFYMLNIVPFLAKVRILIQGFIQILLGLSKEHTGNS